MLLMAATASLLAMWTAGRLTTDVRYRLPNGAVKTATISLMFPAISGTVTRVWTTIMLLEVSCSQTINSMATAQGGDTLLHANAASEHTGG
jgi:hypothetical protein